MASGELKKEKVIYVTTLDLFQEYKIDLIVLKKNVIHHIQKKREIHIDYMYQCN